ncbi:hypothetical protein A9404_02985 [Halothiobacillus diazotrophicus]|uniref:LysM domain-containing protein n=1 Tax=Halothiobacillus diazotrophicus TaxID=1860122 RepID=A0A191ZF26_9GAMM|nr:FimV/HubP family polar landmark protein [Halothiobacillus diazotrophicus]ANJ66481.1 hypothetical protein A9404_02985 [Halothiobacillus diazotrophicus]
MRKLSWIIAGILCTTPAVLLAAELGAPKLESHLTEKLKVTIPITGLNGTPLDEIKVRLAPESYYQQAGISMDPLAGNLMFQVKSGAKGPYLLVSSKRSISDPILSMLLEVQTSHGTFIKEYDLLLNPPVHGDSHRTLSTQYPQISPQSPAAQSTATPISATTNASTQKTPVWHTVADVPDIKLDGEYKVKRGDTLYDIAKKSADGTQVPVRPLMQAIINANPQAFVDGNGNTLMAGATLKVPMSKTVKTAAPEKTASTAENQPKLQLLSPGNDNTGMPSVPQPQSTNTSESTPTSAQPTETAGTTANQPPAKLPAIDSSDTTNSESATASSMAQQTNEAIASIDAKSEAMSHQIELLNSQLKQVQDQIVVRNQSIDQLQKKIHESQSQTQSLQKQLEEQKNSFWIQWGPYLAGGSGLLLIALLLLLFLGRGRKIDHERVEPITTKREEELSPLPTANYSTLTADNEKSLDDKDQAAPVVATAAAAGLAATSSMTSIPPFNAQTLIEESRLLVSYNLHAQAIDMLQDAISDHPEELSLYQELARIHAESKNETALNDVLTEIDHRFGEDHRPDLSDLQEQMAMQSAPIPIFESTNDSMDFPGTETTTSSYDQPLDLDSGVQEPLDIERNEPEADTTSSDDANVLEFSLDDSYPAAPAKETGIQSLNFDEEPKSGDLDLDMVEAPVMPSSTDETSLELHEPEATDIDLAPDTGWPSEGSAPEQAVSNEQNDTRLGLVEAFLGVGDLESYKMIAEEIEGEGDPKVIAALREIEKAHGI